MAYLLIRGVDPETLVLTFLCVDILFFVIVLYMVFTGKIQMDPLMIMGLIGAVVVALIIGKTFRGRYNER